MRLFDLFENAEPSDDELFGKDDSWDTIPSIIKMLRSYHRSTMAELDTYDDDVRDELEDEAEQADWIVDLLEKGDIKKGIVNFHLLDYQTRGTMSEFMKSYNVDMKKVYASILGETPSWLTENEPSDDELFGEDLYNKHRIVDLLTKISVHLYHTYDNEDIHDSADTIHDAATDFETYGMEAGCEKLMDIGSPTVMDYVKSMFENKLKIDIYKMFRKFAPNAVN